MIDSSIQFISNLRKTKMPTLPNLGIMGKLVWETIKFVFPSALSVNSFVFFLNVFTQFAELSDKNIFHWPRCYHIASSTHMKPISCLSDLSDSPNWLNSMKVLRSGKIPLNSIFDDRQLTTTCKFSKKSVEIRTVHVTSRKSH